MRIYLKTFGCASNRADSEAILHILDRSNFQIVESPKEADAVVVNTCTVRGETQHKVLKYIRSLGVKRVLVTGCMAAAQPALVVRYAPQAFIVSPNNMESMPNVLQGNLGPMQLRRECIPPPPAPFLKGLKYTMAISRGCTGSCSYCIVRFARGCLKSVPIQSLITLARGAIEEGAKEIQITAQDTGVFGADIGEDLPSLLNAIGALDGDFRVRVGMLNPSSTAPILDALLNAYASEKIFKFIHIPVQSGSNRVLEAMRRNYTVSDFSQIVDSFRSKFQSLCLATDVIVGFPGEAEDDFNQTTELISEVRPDKTHIARFSPRPHTTAASLDQVPEPVKKKRSSILTVLKKEIQLGINSKFIGCEVDAMVLEAKSGQLMIARTDSYKPVWIKHCNTRLLGKRVTVEIESCTPYSICGLITRR
ncbi:MAG: tRNA (N(6)-L-threonylcarbamoyladenosine(37)-C(2))-methylthiotransferase [Candidatus Methanomethylicus sp.]|nr:tRNA (N(6)-L-threonylcarbamoyladenosine(37)-C(2))-methylthiotransferase [Candidatus Methanomethylicus sp.]